MERKDQKTNDTWDLSALALDSNDWEKKVEEIKEEVLSFDKWKGTLSKSSDSFYASLTALYDLEERLEALINWAFLCYNADSTNPIVVKNRSQADILYATFVEKASFFTPELMSLNEETLHTWLKEERFKDYRIAIEKELRNKKHVLSEKEERILSLHSANESAFQTAFQDINNIDLDFGTINGEKLTHSTYAKFIRSEDESVRAEAYKKMYAAYEKNEHVIARIYEGSVKNDIFLSRSRGYSSTLAAALYPDNVPESVYYNLISSVHDAFPVLHRYYSLRAKLIGKKSLKHYDVYVPMVKGVDSNHTYDEATEIIKEAVMPLGQDYSDTLYKGLTTERWVDRYENTGKRSGAFSAGCFTGNPYILTNFEPSVIDSVFTLIHEGGHSMHSYYSTKNNPFPHYNYTIFEAEVASTFNENLLSHYLLEHTTSKEEKAYLISKNLDDIVATFFRQTMFAEFELLIHQDAESNKPITLDSMRRTYRTLLEEYFGPNVLFEENSDLEGLRIPHFYNAFYVYKYATGIAASIALSQRVLNGGEKEKNEYLSFLKSGGSHYPIDSLKLAGVDMSTPSPILSAVAYFSSLMDELEELTK